MVLIPDVCEQAKLEKLSREEANLKALLRDLQEEALMTTQTAGPWQGEVAEAEERAWWQPAWVGKRFPVVLTLCVLQFLSEFTPAMTWTEGK